MDPADILPSIERLDDAVDDLEEALQPLINNVTDVASRLPLLDKAKFYVLMTYSIESMLFSALRLNGVDAKEHPIFKELTRVRQYFDKIKNVEFPPENPAQSINKEAAIRLSVFLRLFLYGRISVTVASLLSVSLPTYSKGLDSLTCSSIRADLADNKEVNTKLTEMIARERAKAALKARNEKRKLGQFTLKEEPTEEAESKEPDSEESDDEAEPEVESQPKKKQKKERKDKSERKEKKEKKEKGKKSKKEKEKKSKKSSKE
ncbi:Sas10/Utp3/C1D family-domain-containing protein [Xylaria venustula]|nr:Sas10/Utp3/C1D family-domain-containing protein [Xylaria venustula]